MISFPASPQTTKIRHENERLTAEITRLKKLLANSPDGAVGGVDSLLSDSNSFDAHSTDDSGGRVEKLENELRISKELIQSKSSLFFERYTHSLPDKKNVFNEN